MAPTRTWAEELPHPVRGHWRLHGILALLRDSGWPPSHEDAAQLPLDRRRPRQASRGSCLARRRWSSLAHGTSADSASSALIERHEDAEDAAARVRGANLGTTRCAMSDLLAGIDPRGHAIADAVTPRSRALRSRTGEEAAQGGTGGDACPRCLHMGGRRGRECSTPPTPMSSPCTRRWATPRPPTRGQRDRHREPVKKLLGSATSQLGLAVDLDLRPEGKNGPMSRTVESSGVCPQGIDVNARQPCAPGQSATRPGPPSGAALRGDRLRRRVPCGSARHTPAQSSSPHGENERLPAGSTFPPRRSGRGLTDADGRSS